MANVFRADHIGSLVKPPALLDAEVAAATRGFAASALAAAQDAAILKGLELQKEVVMTVLSDGCLRRLDRDAPYVAGIRGLQAVTKPEANVAALRAAHGVADKLAGGQRLFQDETRFLSARTRAAYKVNLMMPSALALRYFSPGLTERSYPGLAQLATAFAPLIQAEADALLRDGVAYLQFDGCAYDPLYESAAGSMLDVPDANATSTFDDLLDIDRALVAALAKAPNATVGVHVSRMAALHDTSDRFERMAMRLFEALPSDRLLLEYGEPASHDFQCLAAMPEGRVAVLGLVRTEAEPEGINELIGRLERAACYTDERNLALSPRRGFGNPPGSSAEAMLAAQRETLVRASEVVQQFWGLEV